MIRLIVVAMAMGTLAGCGRATPLQPAPPDRMTIVSAVRAAMGAGRLEAGHEMVDAHETTYGRSPQSLLAYSWIARVALSGNQLDEADRVATETYQRALAMLETREMDAEPDLPTALGAAIEVLGQSAARQGRRSEAVVSLTRELDRYQDTSLVKRIQKNLHLIGLQGQPAPPLSADEWLSDTRGTTDLRGRVTVMFFWAHWCADCKRQGPILEELLARHGSAGLAVLAPTQLFGYAQAGTPATPHNERAYIARVRESAYAWLPEDAVPLDEANHRRFGVSTTPTIVIVDRAGLVQLYHPGVMSLDDLERTIRPLLAPTGP